MANFSTSRRRCGLTLLSTPKASGKPVVRGPLAVAQYSSGPIGRLVWQDILGLVEFYKKQAK
jgi:hypothetical protein